MMAEQRGFFDLDERYRALSAVGDPLERSAAVVEFEVFGPTSRRRWRGRAAVRALRCGVEHRGYLAMGGQIVDDLTVCKLRSFSQLRPGRFAKPLHPYSRAAETESTTPNYESHQLIAGDRPAWPVGAGSRPGIHIPRRGPSRIESSGGSRITFRADRSAI